GERMTRGRWISLAVGTAIAMAVAVSVSLATGTRRGPAAPKLANPRASEGGSPYNSTRRIPTATLKGSPYEAVRRPFQGRQNGETTARGDLEKTVAAMEERLARTPADVASAVTLADALLRQTRVTGNAGLAMRAESALNTALAGEPANYNARRMLAAVYLSQHRFTDAIREAQRCREIRSDDAWGYGVLGDANIELGNYEDAFDAFDRMTQLRPDAASYARASYARELQGDLDGALRLMTMAAEATAPQDPEALAW